MERISLISESQEPGQQVIVANGMIECVSAQDLSEKVGFSIYDLENLPFNINETIYTSCWGDLAEIQYNESEM